MDSNIVNKPKRAMTDKQKTARCLNLAAGRKKRMEAMNHGQIDESDSSDDLSSDNDAFVLTKAKEKSGTQK